MASLPSPHGPESASTLASRPDRGSAALDELVVFPTRPRRRSPRWSTFLIVLTLPVAILLIAVPSLVRRLYLLPLLAIPGLIASYAFWFVMMSLGAPHDPSGHTSWDQQKVYWLDQWWSRFEHYVPLARRIFFNRYVGLHQSWQLSTRAPYEALAVVSLQTTLLLAYLGLVVLIGQGFLREASK